MEELQLNKSKIKTIDYLINKIGVKEERLDTPLFSFLIGAGCSISSKIPSGDSIMKLCSQLSFFDQYETGNPILIKNYTSFIDYIKAIDNYIETNLQDIYKSYKKEKEEGFLKAISKEEVLKKLPLNIIGISEKETINVNSDSYDKFCKRVHTDNLYGKWFETYSEDPRERQKLIENIIDWQEISGEYIIFSHLVKRGFIHNIFTTNFDDIINESLSIYAATKARVFSHNETARYVSINSKKPNIIKLHGDYLFENIKNTTEETGALEDNMSFKLNEALSHLGLVVIGYNGADYSIMNSINLIKSQRPFPLIWCVRDINKLHWRVIDLINNTSNSYIVEVEDFTTLMIKLWTRYGSGSVDLIADAEQRQLKVTEALEQTKQKVNVSDKFNPEDRKIFNDFVDAVALLKVARDTDDLQERMSLLKQAIEIEPNNVNPEVLNLLSVTYMQLGRERGIEPKFYQSELEQAIDAARRAIVIDPNYNPSYSNLGNALRILAIARGGEEANAMNREAIENFKMIINNSPNYYLPYSNIGQALRMLGISSEINESEKLFEEGIKYFEIALSLNYNVQAVHYSYGNLLLAYGDKVSGEKSKAIYSKALDRFRKLLEIDPKSTIALNNIGASLLRLYKFEEGKQAELLLESIVDAFEQAINLNPNYTLAYVNVISSIDKLITYKNEKEVKSLKLKSDRYSKRLAAISS